MSEQHVPHIPACPECGASLASLTTKQERLEAENTNLFRQCSHLKAELTKIQGGGSDTVAIAELHGLWLTLRGLKPGLKPALTEDRTKAYRKLLKDYGQEDAEKVIHQHRKTPYLVFGKWAAAGKPNELRDDVTDVTAKAKYVEALITAYDGDDLIPPPMVAETPTMPEAAHVHRLDTGWSPLSRATSALRREYGFDTAVIEWNEKTLLNADPVIVRVHAWCPKHPFAEVGMRLWEDSRGGRVHAECDGACFESEILRAVFSLEVAQVERAKALMAFEVLANPDTLDKLVKALDVHKGDSKYRIGRRIGIHSDDALHVDPRSLDWGNAA